MSGYKEYLDLDERGRATLAPHTKAILKEIEAAIEKCNNCEWKPRCLFVIDDKPAEVACPLARIRRAYENKEEENDEAEREAERWKTAAEAVERSVMDAMGKFVGRAITPKLIVEIKQTISSILQSEAQRSLMDFVLKCVLCGGDIRASEDIRIIGDANGVISMVCPSCETKKEVP